MRVFQIGFNTCATTALYKMFAHAGVPSIHSSGRIWRIQKHPAVVGKNVQETIHDNIEGGHEPLQGLEDFDAFFDMEFTRTGLEIENYRRFAVLAEAYPDAKFILNVRDKKSWLKSRARRANGDYLAVAMERLNGSEQDVLEQWSQDFDTHNRAVQAYFADKPERLIVFDIDTTPITDLIAFMAPEIRLRKRHWFMHRSTDVVAKKRDWTDLEPKLQELIDAA